jgi:hypothetical protein
LRSGRLHGRTTRPIEQAELDSSSIDNAPHDSAQGVDLTNQMTFADAADRGVAGHLPDEIQVESQQRRVGAEPRSSGRSFTTSVAASDNNDIKNFIEDHFK